MYSPLKFGWPHVGKWSNELNHLKYDFAPDLAIFIKSCCSVLQYL